MLTIAILHRIHANMTRRDVAYLITNNTYHQAGPAQVFQDNRQH